MDRDIMAVIYRQSERQKESDNRIIAVSYRMLQLSLKTDCWIPFTVLEHIFLFSDFKMLKSINIFSAWLNCLLNKGQWNYRITALTAWWDSFWYRLVDGPQLHLNVLCYLPCDDKLRATAASTANSGRGRPWHCSVKKKKKTCFRQF